MFDDDEEIKTHRLGFRGSFLGLTVLAGLPSLVAALGIVCGISYCAGEISSGEMHGLKTGRLRIERKGHHPVGREPSKGDKSRRGLT